MNKIFSILKVMVLSGILFSAVSCEDFMSTKTNRYMLAEDNQLTSPNDTVYSVLGILSKVQQLGDKYVLMGELRADLLDVTASSQNDLRNLSNHTVDTSSPYADTKDFYAIINNCNYFLAHADTNMAVRGQKSFVREYNAVKSIRAWTYFQLALNYGKVRYIEEPILTVDDLGKSYPEMNPEELINKLIPDLESTNPLTNIELPGYGSIGTASSRYLFINTRFLLGDLYLWRASFTHSKADYEMAATYYARLIDGSESAISPNNVVTWYNDSFLGTVDSWSQIFKGASSNSELFSIISLAQTTYDGTVSQLSALSRNNQIVISESYQDISDAQIYCLREGTNPAKYNNGDLRLKVVAPSVLPNNLDISDLPLESQNRLLAISKYVDGNIMLYRKTLLYLRYAEAVNRAEKPSLAFAVLKYGLKGESLRNTSRVNPTEVAGTIPYITIFNAEKYDNVIGIHARGTGNAVANVQYLIPDYTRYDKLQDINGNDSIVKTTDLTKLMAAKADSISFVENAICDELALETGLEGNRFQDLMRISQHRNEPTFLAKKVAAKHASNKEYFQNLLSDKKNWFLPTR